MRIVLDGTQMYAMATADVGKYGYLVEYVMNVAGRNAANFWSDHLSTIPVEGDMTIYGEDCKDAFMIETSPDGEEEEEEGDDDDDDGGEEYGGDAAFTARANRTYANADLVIYLLMDDGPCLVDAGMPPIAYTKDCASDQYDRPIAGTIFLCTEGNFDGISGNDDDDIELAQRRKLDEVLQHEYAHLLGMSGTIAPYWRDATNGGRPYAHRPLVESEISCPNGKTDSVYLPSTSTHAMGTTSRGNAYYEVITPTVRNVVMNQFNCHDKDVVRGARLDTNDGNCIGSHWSTVSLGFRRVRYSRHSSMIASPTGTPGR